MWNVAKSFFRYGNKIVKKEEEVKGNDALINKMLSDDALPSNTQMTKVKEVKEVKNVRKVTVEKRNISRASNNERPIVKTVYKKGSNNRPGKSYYNTAVAIKKAAINEGYVGPTCSHCGSISVIKTAKEHTKTDKNFCYWVCPKCEDVSVTTSKGSYQPSGILADSETRKLRAVTHRYIDHKKKDFDYDNGLLNRWIARNLNVPNSKSWVGQLTDKELCNLILVSQEDIYKKKHAYIFDVPTSSSDK